MPLHAPCTLLAHLCMPLHASACHCMLHAHLCMPLHVTACPMHAFACLCMLLHAPCTPPPPPSQSPKNMNNGQSCAPGSSLFIDTHVLYYVLYGYLSSWVSYRYLFFIIIFSSFYNPPFSLLLIYIYLPLYVPTSLSRYHCTQLRFLLTLNST